MSAQGQVLYPERGYSWKKILPPCVAFVMRGVTARGGAFGRGCPPELETSLLLRMKWSMVVDVVR